MFPPTHAGFVATVALTPVGAVCTVTIVVAAVPHVLEYCKVRLPTPVPVRVTVCVAAPTRVAVPGPAITDQLPPVVALLSVIEVPLQTEVPPTIAVGGLNIVTGVVATAHAGTPFAITLTL